MKLLFLLGFAFILLFGACNNENSDQVKQVDKNGSIEVSLSTAHIDSAKDLLTTHYTVWRKVLKCANLIKRTLFRLLASLPPKVKMTTATPKM
jgi:hypothetical protein